MATGLVRLAEADEIAQLVLSRYGQINKKGKPLVRSNGVREWTILAGVVLQIADSPLECVSVATGVKAIPDTVVGRSKGRVVHDMHAEILALRGLNRVLLDECAKVARGEPSRWVSQNQNQDEHPFVIDPDLRVHLYISAPPCGDASISQLEGDAWDQDLPAPDTLIRGRNHFNALGYLRTKPGRADSVVTMSKSCSDKLALRQINGLLLSPLRMLLGPQNLFLFRLVCPEFSDDDFGRAFSRWAPKDPTRFSWSRCSLMFSDGKLESHDQPSPNCVLWTPGCSEVLTNGVRQGSKLLSIQGTSVVSRHSLASHALRLVPCASESLRYSDVKNMAHARAPKFYPPGWVSTTVDDFEVALDSRPA